MSDRDSEFGAFLAGIVVGGLVGAAVALLLAPQSGEDTRTLIKDKSIELKDKAAVTAEEARHPPRKPWKTPVCTPTMPWQKQKPAPTSWPRSPGSAPLICSSAARWYWMKARPASSARKSPQGEPKPEEGEPPAEPAS